MLVFDSINKARAYTVNFVLNEERKIKLDRPSFFFLHFLVEIIFKKGLKIIVLYFFLSCMLFS
jgi:hypothetical protein